jgi:hypothetical protein
MNGRLSLPLLVLASPLLLAWESESDFPTLSWVTSTHGRANARVYYESEHREILEDSLVTAMVPSAWNSEYAVMVMADDQPTYYSSPTLVASGEPYTLNPVSPLAVDRLRERTFVPSMFAELPDFSYALHDWSSGNENCPPAPPSVTGDDCYLFGGWMGTINSNHFVPQATQWFWLYHAIAQQIGDQCQDMQSALGYPLGAGAPIPDYLTYTLDCGVDGLCPGQPGYDGPDQGELDGIDDFLHQCTVLQLVLESIGHHFFQDSWSAGHMWHRWGGPLPGHFTGLPQGLATAMTSGMIHGSKSVSHMDDRMCQANQWRYAWGAAAGTPLPPGHPAYAASGFPYGVYNGVGDLYLGDLPSQPAQNTQFTTCTALALGETYAAGPQVLGGLGGYSGSGTISSSSSLQCHDQRATNQAMFDGSYLDTTVWNRPINSSFVYGLIKFKSGVTGAQALLLKTELNRIFNTFSAAATADPNGIGTATNTGPLAFGTFMGVPANEAYIPGTATYSDPLPPWDGSDVREERLMRVWNRTTAPQWCEQITSQNLVDMRERCQSLTGDAKEAACQTCEEFASRQIRIGCGPGDYETDREPLCNYIAADPAAVDYIYIDLESNPSSSGYDPESEDAADAASMFCRDGNPPIGPCVNAYLFDDYDVGYCYAIWYPFFYCGTCSTCLPQTTALGVIDSAFDESQLTILWTSPDGTFSNPNAATTTFTSSTLLWPASCFITDATSACATLDVWDPLGNHAWDSDCAYFECYGAAY